MRYVLFLLLCLPPFAALAKCPPGKDFGDQTAQHLTALRLARTEAEAAAAADALWSIWQTAPDGTAQDLLDFAIARREAYDFEHAERILDDLIDYCPTFAEAWNQRAFARFLRDDYDGALADIEVALDMIPYHFGALSGRGLAYMRQGRMQEGQRALREAVRVHPFLRERSMILEEFDDDI